MSIKSREISNFYNLGYWSIFFFAVGITLLLHFRSFCVPHTEGDEVVYLTLARDMNWDLSHYTTRDDPDVSKFPYSIYRNSLFHHPPLFPLILKIGGIVLENAPLAGLIFANFAMVLLLYATCRLMIAQSIPAGWGSIALAGVTFCPLLLSSSMQLHHETLMACFMTSGLVIYLEALKHPSLGRAILAGMLLCIGFNLRYNSLLFLPILLGLQINHIFWPPWQASDRLSVSPSQDSKVSPLLVPGIVFLMIITLGLHHYYRILATYGTLMPSAFIIPDDSVVNWPYLVRLSKATRGRTLLHLIMIYPILLIFLLPSTYRLIWQNWQNRSGECLFLVIFLYLFLAELWFSYSGIHYFAGIIPCLFLGLPWLIRNLPPLSQKIACYLAVLSLFFMIGTGFLKTQVAPPGTREIMPVLYWYLPPLLPLYHP